MLEKLPAGLGRALRSVHAAAEDLLITNSAVTGTNAIIELTSPAVAYGEALPARFTADGDGVSPPLSWRCVPADAQGLVLLIEDADSPTPRPLVHAIVWDLPGVDADLPEGALSRKSAVDTAGLASSPADAMGRNSYFQARYLPPDPPPGHGVHRYVFQIYALDKVLQFESPPGRTELVEVMRGHVVAKGLLLATYERT